MVTSSSYSHRPEIPTIVVLVAVVSPPSTANDKHQSKQDDQGEDGKQYNAEGNSQQSAEQMPRQTGNSRT